MNRLPGWMGPIAFGVIVFWLIYAAAGTNVFGRLPFPEAVVDYRIQYEESRSIVNDGSYHMRRIFPYPPPAVALFYLTALPNYFAAASLRLCLTLVAAFGTLALGTSLVGLRRHPLRWPVALGALALANYCVVWDLRSQNSNMLFCFLLAASLAMLQRERDGWAGFFLAASIAIKLFPVFLVPYFLWIGRRRAFAWAVTFLILFFVLLPLLVFRSNFIHVYASWVEAIRNAANEIAHKHHPILISISSTLRNGLKLAPNMVGWVNASLAMIWIVIAALAIGFKPSVRRTRMIDGWNLAVDAGILVLAPIVLSPYLEAYHLVPVLLLAMALLQRFTLPGAIRRPAHFSVICAIVAGQIALHYSGSFHVRGLGLYLLTLLLVASVAIVRVADNQARRSQELNAPI